MKIFDWCKARPWTWAVASGATCCLAGYGAGRFTTPTKVETRETVREVKVVDEHAISVAVASAKAEWQKHVDDHTITKTIYKEGKIAEKIVYVDRDTNSSGNSASTQTVTVEVEKKIFIDREVVKEKIVTNDPPRLTLAATIGVGFTAGSISPPAYGLLALGRVWGPLVLGAQAEGNLTGGSARGVVGITF